MRKHLLLLLSAAAAGLLAMSAPGIAQQKTVKTCVEEWRANRAANQAAGITQRAYVERCRAGTAAQTAPPPAQAPAATNTTRGGTAAGTAAPRKTVRACVEEWRANRAANQAAGVTQRAYVEKCRAGAVAAQPAPSAAPATANEPPPPAPRRSTTATAPSATPAPSRAPAGTMGDGQYQTEAQAKARCPGDTVVWVNLDSKIYHYSSYRNYGHTKNGAYMCERDTAAAGHRAARNEKRP
jgi:hypothetical protein